MKHIYFSLILVLSFTLAHAQWNPDTSARNIICDGSALKIHPHLCSDGNKGAIIVWEDFRNSKQRIYAQHVDSGGHTKLANNGIIISDTSVLGSSSFPNAVIDAKSITPDGTGGAYITWEHDITGGAGNIELTRINSAGGAAWGGTKFIATANDNRAPQLISDGHNGAIIYWDAYVPGGNHAFMQWVDSSGRMRLQANGQQVSTYNTSAHYDCKMATDNNYNAYMVFGDNDTLRLVKVDSGGSYPWGQKGKILSKTYVNYGNNYSIISDGDDGVIVFWNDKRNGSVRTDIFAQHITTDSMFTWGTNALLVDSTSGINHTYLNASSDGNHGSFLNFGYGRLFVQHVSAGGKVSWNSLKPVITTLGGGQNYASLDADGNNGVLIGWDDGRSSGGIYAQDFDTTGNYRWQHYAAPVFYGVSGSATSIQIISTKDNSGIGTFSYSNKIYAARFTSSIINTGSKEIIAEENWNIYPNPSAGKVYISNPSLNSSPATIQVFNAIGQLILEQKLRSFSPMSEIDLPADAKGVLVMKIISDSRASTHRLVVQ